MKGSIQFEEPVRFLVVHPAHGELVVPAYCVVDAKIQAANHWEVAYEDIAAQCRIGVDKEALRRLRDENGTSNQNKRSV